MVRGYEKTCPVLGVKLFAANVSGVTWDIINRIRIMPGRPGHPQVFQTWLAVHVYWINLIECFLIFLWGVP